MKEQDSIPAVMKKFFFVKKKTDSLPVVSVDQIKTPLVPQDQGLVPVLEECRKQLIALKKFIIIIINTSLVGLIAFHQFHI